jgi:hypothetical protein
MSPTLPPEDQPGYTPPPAPTPPPAGPSPYAPGPQPKVTDTTATTTTGTTTTTDTGVGQPNATVPGEGEVWSIAGKLYLVYFVPNTEPPVPLAWEIEDEYRDAYFGNQAPAVDRTLTAEQFTAAGGLMWGFAQEIVPTSGEAPVHPWQALEENWDLEVQYRPWLADPEIAALVAGAYLEGREITDAELASTEWWQTHTAGERASLALAAQDPATYEETISDNIMSVADALRTAGVNNASNELVEWLALQVTTGSWSTTLLNSQIAALSDPYSQSELDPTLKKYLQGLTKAGTQDKLDKTQNMEDVVKETVRRWLGPAFGNWSDQQISQWAGTLRNDPDGLIRLEQMLSDQRVTLFPDYTDPSKTYDDISSPWRNVYFNAWGEDPNELDPFFVDLVKANDLSTAQTKLINEGLVRGKNDMVNRVIGDMLQAFGASNPVGL